MRDEDAPRLDMGVHELRRRDDRHIALPDEVGEDRDDSLVRHSRRRDESPDRNPVEVVRLDKERRYKVANGVAVVRRCLSCHRTSGPAGTGGEPDRYRNTRPAPSRAVLKCSTQRRPNAARPCPKGSAVVARVPEKWLPKIARSKQRRRTRKLSNEVCRPEGTLFEPIKPHHQTWLA